MFPSRLKKRLLLSETAGSKNKRLHWRADQQDMFFRVSRVRDTACRHLLANPHRDLCVKWRVAQSVDHLFYSASISWTKNRIASEFVGFRMLGSDLRTVAKTACAHVKNLTRRLFERC